MAIYNFFNNRGRVRVTIDGGPADGDLTAVTVQTSEGTDNILSPAIYTAATLRLSTTSKEVYRASFIGAEVTINAYDGIRLLSNKNYFTWSGRVVANCANMDYNQEREEIELQAVDTLTLAKSETYDGPVSGTPIAILLACLPSLLLAFDPALVSGYYYSVPTPFFNGNHHINLSAMLPKDDSKRVTRADVMEAVLRYCSCRAIGMIKTGSGENAMAFVTNRGRKVAQTNWIVYKYGHNYLSEETIPIGVYSLGGHPDGTPVPYRSTAQVTLLDPYKSYSITAHFPGIEIADETYTPAGEDAYTVVDLNEWEASPAGRRAVKQRYRKGSQSTYSRWVYLSPTNFVNNQGWQEYNDLELPVSAPVAVPDEFNKDVTRPEYLAPGTYYYCGAIHVETAVGDVTTADKTGADVVMGVPTFTEHLMLYGLQAFAHCVAMNEQQVSPGVTHYYLAAEKFETPFYELYRRTINAHIVSSERQKMYLVINGTVTPTFRNNYWFGSNGIGNNTIWDSVIGLYDHTWRIPCRLYLTKENGDVTQQNFNLALDLSEASGQWRGWNRAYSLIKDVTWADGVETDGYKVAIPEGRWTSVALAIGLPYRLRVHTYGAKRNTGAWCAYWYIDGLTMDIEYGDGVPQEDSDAKYGWNNEALQIDGNEVEEETSIATYDGQHMSQSVVATLAGEPLTELIDVLRGSTAAPEQLRVDQYAQQYETSTFTLTTTLGGPPQMFAVYNHELATSGMTVESYAYDLATNLSEVTLVDNKI